MKSTNGPGLTDRYGLGTETIPLESFVSPSHFEREREKVFGDAWLNVGRVEDLAETGSFRVKELEILRTSVLLVRGKDGVIRGFHNMCRHRGNKVIRAGIESGVAKGFACSFHGWTYNLDGSLAVVPDEGQFFNFDRCQYGLTPIATEIWEGFIFVNPAPKQSLSAWLGELDGAFGKNKYFDGATHVGSYQAVVRANWKVVLDAFIEAYHAGFLHKRTVADLFTDPANPLCRLLSARLYSRHHSVSVAGHPSHRPTKIENILAEAMSRGVLPIQADAAQSSLPLGVNPDRAKDWAFDFNWIYPNFYLAVMQGGMYATYHFWPRAVDETVWQTDHYTRLPVQQAAARVSWEFTKSLLRDTQREDLITLENTQSMLRSGAMDHMILSNQEVAIRHRHKVIMGALAT